MVQRLLPIVFSLLAGLIFAAEIFGMGWLAIWLLSYETWWAWGLLCLLAIGSLVAMFFLLWMLSIAFWESKELVGTKRRY